MSIQNSKSKPFTAFFKSLAEGLSRSSPCSSNKDTKEPETWTEFHSKDSLTSHRTEVQNMFPCHTEWNLLEQTHFYTFLHFEFKSTMPVLKCISFLPLISLTGCQVESSSTAWTILPAICIFWLEMKLSVLVASQPHINICQSLTGGWWEIPLNANINDIFLVSPWWRECTNCRY